MMDGADEERLLRALAIVERLEWSLDDIRSDAWGGNEQHTEFTNFGSLCPFCKGSEEASEHYPPERWGHRYDCEIRTVLGRPTNTVQNVAKAERILRKRAHEEIMRTQREGPWKEFREGKFKAEEEQRK